MDCSISHHLAVTLHKIKNRQDEQELHRASKIPELIPKLTPRKDTTAKKRIHLFPLSALNTYLNE